MGQFRTSSLFHYTKSIDILYSILKEGLIPNYCYEDLSYERNPERGIGFPMVSFCDIPLSKTNLFVERYGQYAIGLKKDWAGNKRINPILYAKDEKIQVSLSFQKNIENYYKKELKKYGGDDKQVSFDLSDGPKPQIVAFINSRNAHSANQSIHGMIKKYYGEYDGNIQINYEENEWRYLVEDTERTPWYWNKAEYDEWRGDRSIADKPKPTAFLVEKKLLFTANDITFIVVAHEKDVSQMVNFISTMRIIGGNAISEEDKLMLYTRIISLERIKNDF
ncbi:MAG: hypothetical protein J6B15_04845 [Muribaculaceae bacterium]|nr:hypothetical protein [Muribaculaceae bacterium]